MEKIQNKAMHNTRDVASSRVFLIETEGNIEVTELQKELFVMQDLPYRDFQSKLMPTVAKETIIGVRTPELRKLAKEFAEMEEKEQFLSELPHKYYEENNLHALLLEKEKDYEQLIARLDEFLPHVDNWATCDMMRPKVLRKHLPEFLLKIKEWLASEHTYTIRYSIGMLLSFYLDDAFQTEYLEWIANVHSEEYYVRMMVAWYFATALAKQYEQTIAYLEQHRLSVWEHNKTIQKAIESYRMTDGQKDYLRTLKRK